MKGSGNFRRQPEHHYPAPEAVGDLDHRILCGLSSWEARSHFHDACLLRNADRDSGEQFV